MSRGTPTRGQLLRAVLQTAVELRDLNSVINAGQKDVSDALIRKSDLQAKIADTDAELVALRAQHAYESANDRELVQLQRANNVMANRKGELARITVLARTERDKSKADQTTAYYTRLGAALEHTRLQSSGTLAIPSHSSTARHATSAPVQKLQTEVDALWRRVSANSVAVKDAACAAVAFQGGESPCGVSALFPLVDSHHPLSALQPTDESSAAGASAVRATAWLPSAQAASASTAIGTTSVFSASPGGIGIPPSEPPSIPSAPGYLSYASLGRDALTADTERAADALRQLGDEHGALLVRAQEAQGLEDLLGADSSAPLGDMTEPESATTDTSRIVPPSPVSAQLEMCFAQLVLVRQNLDLQLSIVDFVRSIVAVIPQPVTA